MKEEFLKRMQEDENLLYCGVSNPSKTNTQLLRFIFGILALICFWIISIVVLDKHGFNVGLLILFIVLTAISALLVYGLIYNLLSKWSKIKDEYFVTDKRIASYNMKKGFVIREIAEIKYICIAREKKRYGDIIFNFEGASLMEQMKKSMIFKGIEEPRIIVDMITQINKNIYVSDDRISIFGNKI